jgi:AcrR family transcriptional regulator
VPKLVDRKLRREEVLAATSRVIAAHGLDAATMRRIAEEAGCTTGRVTHYFADKDEILVAALRAVHRAAATRMAPALDREDALAGLEAVLFEALPLDEERRREWRVWLAFWGRAQASGKLVAEQRRRYAEWRQLIRALLAAAARRGDLRADADLALEVDHLLATVDGLGIEASFEPDRLTPARQRAIVRAHLARLLPPGRSAASRPRRTS